MLGLTYLMPDCWLEVILHSEVPTISYLGTRFPGFPHPGMVSKFPVPTVCITFSLSKLHSSPLTQKTEMLRSQSQTTASGRLNGVFICTLPLAEGRAIESRELPTVMPQCPRNQATFTAPMTFPFIPLFNPHPVSYENKIGRESCTP